MLSTSLQVVLVSLFVVVVVSGLFFFSLSYLYRGPCFCFTTYTLLRFLSCVLLHLFAPFCLHCFPNQGHRRAAMNAARNASLCCISVSAFFIQLGVILLKFVQSWSNDTFAIRGRECNLVAMFPINEIMRVTEVIAQVCCAFSSV